MQTPGKRLLIPALLFTLAAMLPPDAHAATEQIPLCATTVSSTLCYYVVDTHDCFIENGVRYCRTMGYYLWEN